MSGLEQLPPFSHDDEQIGSEQVEPVYPEGQVQMSVSMQVPPFSHGAEQVGSGPGWEYFTLIL